MFDGTANELGTKETEGFFVNKVTKNSGAEKAGLQKGDIIKKLDNQKISSYAELTGYINTKRPNDVVQVSVLRDGKQKTLPVKLTKKEKTDFLVIELENHLGGNSSNGENKYSKFPLGAHYLPLPNFEDKELLQFLEEEKIIL